jgi:hypothetical protein
MNLLRKDILLTNISNHLRRGYSKFMTKESRLQRVKEKKKTVHKLIDIHSAKKLSQQSD